MNLTGLVSVCEGPGLPWAHCPASLTLVLTLTLALAGRSGAVCLVRVGSVEVQRVGQRAASAGACSNLPDHLSLTFLAPGTNHLELRMSLASFLASLLLSVLGYSFSPSICSQCFLAFREFLCLIYGGFFSSFGRIVVDFFSLKKCIFLFILWI